MPEDIIVPVPLVTLDEGARTDQPWHKTVYQILGVYPTTDTQIKNQLEEISKYIHHVGLTINAEQHIREELEKLTERPEILLNMMRYMLGQFCHRRLFVFVWKSSRAKWELLSRAFGIWFAMFEWETIELEGKPGKQEAPGENLLIEPASYASLKHWLSTSPSSEVVNEFLDHFKCHLDSYYLTSSNSPYDANEPLNALMDYWNRVFFGQT
jgi:hypothetical protein